MTNEEIIQRGILIRDETEPAQNTSVRVGGGIEGIGRNLAEKDAAIAAEAARNGYYQCTVSGTTLAVTAPGFTLPAHGGNIRIKMSAPATGASTLNINGTGAKQLLYNGAAVSSVNTWEKNEIISVFYDPSGSGQYLASNSQGGGGKAEKIKYDNSQSGLAAENVQTAIDNTVEKVAEVEEVLVQTIVDTRIEQYKDNVTSRTSGSQLSNIWGNRHNVASVVDGIYWKCHGSANSLSVYQAKSGSATLIKTFQKDSSWIDGQWIKLYFDSPVTIQSGCYIGALGYVYFGTTSGVGLQFYCRQNGTAWGQDNNITIGLYSFCEKNRLDAIEENIEEIEEELHESIKTSSLVDREGNSLILPLDRIITNPTGQQISLSENRFTEIGATQGGYLTASQSDGVWTTVWHSSSRHRCTAYIDIHDATKLTIGCDVTANFVYFDENKVCCGNFVGNGSLTAKTTTPPDGAYYLRMNYDTKRMSNTYLTVYYTVDTYNLNPIIAISPDSVTALKPLSGLKVAWYGTSIPHGYPYQNSDQATYSYANRAVTELGGVIQNRCVSGGFIISATNTADTHNQTSRFTDIDPEGTYYSAVNYKTRIVDLIGTADEPDIFVFDWGANDGQFYQSYFNGINLDTVDITTEDIKTFIGAYNTIIKALLTAKPKARIFLVTHYSDDGQSNEMTRKDGYRTMNRLIEKIADYWHIPCNSVYKKTGWIYNRNGISNIRSQWCKDGIHPANSANVESIKFLTKIHKQFLMENYCY